MDPTTVRSGPLVIAGLWTYDCREASAREMRDDDKGVRTALAAAALAIGATSAASAQALPPGADAFVASANALARSASERVDLGRATARLDVLRHAVTEKLLAAGAGQTIYLDTLDEQALLCRVRGAHLAVAAHRNYLQALAARIEEVGKPAQIDNLLVAVKALFAGQSIDLTGAVPSAAELAGLEQLQRERCERDFREFGRIAYGRALATGEAATEFPEAAGFFGPVAALVDAIVSVVAPVVVEGSRIVDEQRRRAAIKAFLADPVNRAAIKGAGTKLADEVASFIMSKRMKLAGVFSEQTAVLRHAPVELAKLDACKALLALPQKPALRSSGAPSDVFVLCWRSAWTQLEPIVASALKAADEYDQIADAGNPDNAKKAFEPLSNALDTLANDRLSPETAWALAVRLIGFAEKVSTATSNENRDRIRKAIDDLVKM